MITIAGRWELPETEYEFTVFLLSHGDFGCVMDEIASYIDSLWQSSSHNDKEDKIEYEIATWIGAHMWKLNLKFERVVHQNDVKLSDGEEATLGVGYNVVFPGQKVEKGITFWENHPADKPFFDALLSPPEEPL